MIIDLRTIEHTPRHFNLLFQPDWWQSEGEKSQILGLDRSLECHIDLFRAGIRYVLEGRLSASLVLSCDRCLEPYRRELDLEFRLFLAAHDPDSEHYELELSEDDMWVHFVKGNEVDLNDIVREQIYLSLPIKFLCREDCSGLCPVCGANINKEKCQCERGEGHPGLSKLKALKFKR